MNKEEFVKELEEIIEDTLFIGESIDDLNDEIAQNTLSISLGKDLASEFATEDLLSFFHQVQNNRKQQIVKNSDHNMILYVWFEWQSARLRFDLISDFHKSLPFGRKYKVIENLEIILEEFLKFPFHDGIPIEEVDEEGAEDEDEFEPFNVYSVVFTND
ncbi:hypothetical protein [Neobacillus sp. YIM B06451]|uniref:hypothetical protein n=1 Tax=Neobacillus sp. YIM B06451 TaxID=3070994 RepID=UPI00293049CF|nr:hypothetical protein [Neobacillus sp. YIM B06451]